MKTDKKRYLAALLLLMLTALMATGVAYGHYEAKTQKELKFNIQMQNAAYLFQGGEGVANFTPLDEATNGWTSTSPDGLRRRPSRRAAPFMRPSGPAGSTGFTEILPRAPRWS